ncbi:hypothetical protein GCM10027597_39000 [Saccharopolyspora tripterygii]
MKNSIIVRMRSGVKTFPCPAIIALNTAPGADVAPGDQEAGTATVSKADSLNAIGSYSSENGSLQPMCGLLAGASPQLAHS